MTISRLLVTGAAGFLGSAIVRQAVNAGLPVLATDRIARPSGFGVDFIPADILEPRTLLNVFKNVYSVCHVAGLVHGVNKAGALGQSFYDVNAVGSENVAHAAAEAGVRHFVFISSVSVYGGVAHGNAEDSECRPEGPYAESKLHAERRLINICQREGINLTILRLATLYGEGDPGNVARLIRSIDLGRFIWVGRGNNLKSLLYYEDAARAGVEVIKASGTGINIYNVAAPFCKLSDIVAAVTLNLEKAVPSWHVPASFALNSAKIMKKLTFNRGPFGSVHGTLHKWLADDYYSTDKFCRTFSFKTEVNLEEGIRKEVAWHRLKYGRKNIDHGMGVGEKIS